MKPTALFLSFLGFLLFAAATITALPVLDSNDRILLNGEAVYLAPAIPNPTRGGGIISTPIRHNNGDSDSCSLAVVSVLFTSGWPVSIFRLTKDLLPLTTIEPLNIAFTYVPPNVCTNSRSWAVVRSPPLGDSVVLFGAQESGATYVSGSFYVRTVDFAKRHYKLVFCEKGKSQCGNIGVKIDSSGQRRLVVTDEEPLLFTFNRVHQKENFNSDLSMVV